MYRQYFLLGERYLNSYDLFSIRSMGCPNITILIHVEHSPFPPGIRLAYTHSLYQRSAQGGQFWIIVSLPRASILEYQNYIIFIRKQMIIWDYASIALGGLFTIVFVVSLFATHKIRQMRMPPEDVDKLVTRGPYRLIRHPNFAGLISMNIAYLFFFRTLWLVPLIIAFGSLWYLEAKHEEMILIERFGNEYKEYMRTTGMFFPRQRI